MRWDVQRFRGDFVPWMTSPVDESVKEGADAVGHRDSVFFQNNDQNKNGNGVITVCDVLGQVFL